MTGRDAVVTVFTTSQSKSLFLNVCYCLLTLGRIYECVRQRAGECMWIKWIERCV